LTLVSVGPFGTSGASFAALVTLAGEIVARYIFFAAGAAKRMPGGIRG
jgi:hypothetical protein